MTRLLLAMSQPQAAQYHSEFRLEFPNLFAERANFRFGRLSFRGQKDFRYWSRNWTGPNPTPWLR